MAARIKSDALEALKAWKDGKAVRSIELGHAHRQVESPGGSPLIDLTQHIHRDQERAHAYCFKIIEFYSEFPLPSHDKFVEECRRFPFLVEESFRELTEEERIGAESLAWKALLVGWDRAIAGHKEEQYIEVTNPEPSPAKRRKPQESAT